MIKEMKIIGKSQHAKKLQDFIKTVAKTDENVFFLGETGVGKELAARMVHMLSERKNKPFIKVNCANLNENLLESELFGYKKGAYTGAIFDKPGLIEEANGGTFFLDEIADISAYLQAKLLSVIEQKEIRRLGENKIRKVNTRFVFSTNRNIYKLIDKGKFRIDLYYRISVLTFNITPLRQRKEDIPLLIESILKKESLKKSKQLSIDQEAFNKLLGHQYYGNVRELENILKRAMIMTNNCTIRKENIQFSEEIRKQKTEISANYSLEKIINALVKHKGNKTKAAKELGISRMHFYRIFNKFIN